MGRTALFRYSLFPYGLLLGLCFAVPAQAQPHPATARTVDALNDSAAAYVDVDAGRVRTFAQAAYGRAAAAGYWQGQGRALYYLGYAADDEGADEAAVAYYEQAVPLLRRLPEGNPGRPLLAPCLLHLSHLQKLAGDYDAAERSSLASIDAYRAAADSAGVAQAHYDLGLLYWHVGRFEDALARYEAALPIWERLGNRRKVSRCLNNIGVLYYHWAGYRQALGYYDLSLHLRREIGDTVGTALVLNNIGKTYQDWGKLDRAQEVYEEAEAHTRGDTNNTRGYTLYNLASLYEARRDHARALAYFDEAEAVYGAVDYTGGVVETRIGKAMSYGQQGDLDAALALLAGALDQARAGGLAVHEATALQALGRVHALRGEHRQALDRLGESLAASERLDKRGMMMDNYRLLSASHEALGDYAQALRAYQQYAAEADLIYGQRSERLLAEVEARYEAERQAREVALLQRRQDRERVVTLVIALSLLLALAAATLLLRANAQKRAANRRLLASHAEVRREHDEQRALLQILCHDLANPLGTIHGCLVTMLADPDSHDEFGAMALQVTRQGIDTIDLVREMQVLDRDRLALEPVNVRQAVDDAVLVLRPRLEAKGLALTVAVDPELAIWAEHRSLTNSVVSNVLTNALKFSPEGSTIEIHARRQGDDVHLVVRDHGIGMPAGVRDNLFDVGRLASRPGTGGESGSGFGLPLVKKFVGLYGGRIEVSSREPAEDPLDHGTEVRLVFRAARRASAAPPERAAALAAA